MINFYSSLHFPVGGVRERGGREGREMEERVRGGREEERREEGG